jgi:hypothetical protein
MDTNNVYVNANFYNETLDQFLPAIAEQSYSDDILKNPSQYVVSIQSLSIPGFNIPIVNMRNYLSGLNDNDTILILRLKYNNVIYSRNVQFFPLTTGFGLDRYYVYNYQQLLDVINTTLVDISTDVNTANPGLITNPPFFAYDPNSRLFNLYCDPLVFDQTLSTPVYISCNSMVYDFFVSFPAINYDNNYITFMVKKLPGNNPITYDGNTYIKMSQENDSRYSWDSVKSILVTTNLPVKKEFISVNTSSSSNLTNLQILTNFNVDPTNTEFFGNIVYTPTSEYRRVNLSGTNPINNVQISVFFQDKNNRISPVILSPRSSFTCKLLFEKK